MNTQKHTQGPWHATNYHVQSLVHEYDGYICKAEGNTKAEAEANARLIASAPDLLQVTKDFLLLAALHDWEGAAIDFAKATLAKVEGVK